MSRAMDQNNYKIASTASSGHCRDGSPLRQERRSTLQKDLSKTIKRPPGPKGDGKFEPRPSIGPELKKSKSTRRLRDSRPGADVVESSLRRSIRRASLDASRIHLSSKLDVWNDRCGADRMSRAVRVYLSKTTPPRPSGVLDCIRLRRLPLRKCETDLLKLPRAAPSQLEL